MVQGVLSIDVMVMESMGVGHGGEIKNNFQLAKVIQVLTSMLSLQTLEINEIWTCKLYSIQGLYLL